MKILSIETSCDETAVALLELEGDFGRDFKFKILGNGLLSQANLHTPYGGVYPNLAKREHINNLIPMLKIALDAAGMNAPSETATDLPTVEKILEREQELYRQFAEYIPHIQNPDIDVIAVTAGPGLEPALWVGINFAKALAHAWQLPLIAADHMEGHIVLSMMLDGKLASFEFPALALLISGGHTELVLSKAFMQYETIGSTRDDAAGEAFDKVARLLDLPYPGGPEISRLAAVARKYGRPTSIHLPRPMMHEDNFDFSFSGLKTAVRKIVEAHLPLTEEMKLQIALEFENTVADVLIDKTLRAAEEHGAQTLIVGGGVSANTFIRAELARKLEGTSMKLLIPPPELATDNAIMIALAGYFHAMKKEFADLKKLFANGNLKLAGGFSSDPQQRL